MMRKSFPYIYNLLHNVLNLSVRLRENEEKVEKNKYQLTLVVLFYIILINYSEKILCVLCIIDGTDCSETLNNYFKKYSSKTQFFAFCSFKSFVLVFSLLSIV